MGDKLLLSFGAKLQRLFDFKCEITKLPIGNVLYVSTPRWRKVLKIVMNEDVRAFQYALEKPKHTKEHIKKDSIKYFVEKFELKPKFKL